jgi:hypothetical protein
MADKKISELGALTAIASGDELVIVDISDTTQSAQGSTKKITHANLVKLIEQSIATALMTLNQQSTGDILDLQDGGTTVARFPDQGGLQLVGQAGGFQSLTGLLGYDSVKQRLVLKHETHDFPVPVDPRVGHRNNIHILEAP